MTGSPTPLVSIVVPCYKGEAFLAHAIDSCLSQSHSNIEIFVVDDGSPDRCAEIGAEFAARDPRVHVLRHRANAGVATAFNTGFDAARGTFFTRLAQDDMFNPDAIRSMVETLEQTSDCGVVYSDCTLVDLDGTPVQHYPTPDPSEALVNDNGVGLCVMWRRSVWERVGRFDPAFDSAEDYDYWLRARQLFRFARFSGAPLLRVRIHEQMGSRVYSAKQEILSARIRARYSGSPLEARRIQKGGYFNAAYAAFETAKYGAALRHLGTAAAYWPFDPKLYQLFLRVLLASAGVGR